MLTTEISGQADPGTDVATANRSRRLGAILQAVRPEIETLMADEETGVARVLFWADDVLHEGSVALDQDRRTLRYNVLLSEFQTLSRERLLQLLELQGSSRFSRVAIDFEHRRIWLSAALGYIAGTDSRSVARQVALDIKRMLERGRVLLGLQDAPQPTPDDRRAAA